MVGDRAGKPSGAVGFLQQTITAKKKEKEKARKLMKNAAAITHACAIVEKRLQRTFTYHNRRRRTDTTRDLRKTQVKLKRMMNKIKTCDEEELKLCG